jgi:hypothetical protein
MTIGEVIKKSESQGGPRVYYILNIFIKFIINKETPCLRINNDCRKEPQKLQKEGPEEEGVSGGPILIIIA